jgi:hypothetical protein
MNYGMGDIAVIDTATTAIVARHPAGATPFGGSLLVRR